MFKGDNNPFLYLFADDEDIYFTKHLVKVNLYQSLFYKAKKRKYEHVFFFFKINKNESEIYCGTKQDAFQYSAVTKNSNSSFFSFTNKKESNYEETKEKYFVFRQKNATIRAVVSTIIREEAKDNCVFVFPIDAFSEIYDTEEHRKEFSTLIEEYRYEKGSQFIFLENDINRIKLPKLPIVNENRKIVWEPIQEEMKLIWKPFEYNQLNRMMKRLSLKYSSEYLSVLEESGYKNNDHAEFLSNKLVESEPNNRPSNRENMNFRNKKDLFEYISQKENYLRLIHHL